MDFSPPGFPVLHCPLEFAQTHVHWINDAIQPSHPLSPPSPPSLNHSHSVQFSRSVVFNSASTWTAACQASLSNTNSQSLLKLTSIKSVIPINHPILCRPLLLLPSVFPSIRVFSKESVLHVRWPKYWSFSFGIHPSNEYSGVISFRIDRCIRLVKKFVQIFP